ncbi:MAG: peptide chain release factor 3, partial [Cohaesibacteraceae bacterium]|nr:peptide chain release factor 3 [Cohaesibacteraceae bacterium]
KSNDDKTLESFLKSNSSNIVTDRDDRPVFLAKSNWELDYAARNNPDIEFLKTRELD